MLKILLLMLVTVYLVLVLGFVGKQYDSVLCKGMDIIVSDSLEMGLVKVEDVKNLIQLDHPELAGNPVTSIDISGIEESLNRFPAISNAQVYTDIQGHLMIELSQRTPIARIEDRDHQHYFLDGEGYIIPATMEYSPHVLYINGEIPGKYRKESRITAGNKLMEDILKMSAYIHADPFWKSQLVQLYVRRNGEFELIPRVGAQIILFGNADRMETKFFKLQTLYNEGFSHTGWNQYEKINLKYINQVICTKR